MDDSQELGTTEIVFRANAVDVLFDRATSMGSLTALWRAKGSPANQQPAQWLRLQQARDLLGALERAGIVGDAALRTREGVRGGTWAHWQLAVAYAHYIDPDFYLAWNEWAAAHIHGSQNVNLDSVAAQLRELQTTLTQIRAQQALAARPRALPGPRHPLAPEAVAILAILRGSDVALSPAHIERVLAAEGMVYSGNYVRVRCMRLARAGYVEHVGHGLYQAVDMEAAQV